MAVHNGERYVADAITSCLGADELVIVDDASTDRTPALIAEAVRRYGEFVRSLVCVVNVGLTVALRTGMLHCRSPYIARQDADDLSLPGRFRAQADYLDANPFCSLVASRVRIIDETGETTRRGCQVRWLPKLQMRLGRNPIVHGSACFRRRDYDAVGGYRETFQMSQDLYLWQRLAKVGTIWLDIA